MKAPFYRPQTLQARRGRPIGLWEVHSSLFFLFDMDGVIIDSTHAHTEAWRRYLAGFDLDVRDIESRMLGKHNDEIVRDFFCEYPLTERDIIDHGARKEQLYREMIAPVCKQKLVPGIKEFLRAHSGTSCAVVTNAEPANVEMVLGLAGIRDDFSVIVNGHQVKRPKPAPDIYFKAASLLNADPRDCIVFEDSTTGIQAARAAGMRVVGVTTTATALQDVDLSIRDFFDAGLEPWLHAANASA
jgi:beta-phosphoglucomutase